MDDLNDFVEWFRTDMAYRAPEQWAGRITWFLNELKDRYGNTHVPPNSIDWAAQLYRTIKVRMSCPWSELDEAARERWRNEVRPALAQMENWDRSTG